MKTFTMRRGRNFYRRGPSPHWTQTVVLATTFATEKEAWDEAEHWGLDFSELLVEPHYTPSTETTR